MTDSRTQALLRAAKQADPDASARLGAILARHGALVLEGETRILRRRGKRREDRVAHYLRNVRESLFDLCSNFEIRRMTVYAYHRDTYCYCEPDCERCEERESAHECCGACFQVGCMNCDTVMVGTDQVFVDQETYWNLCEACFWRGWRGLCLGYQEYMGYRNGRD